MATPQLEPRVKMMAQLQAFLGSRRLSLKASEEAATPNVPSNVLLLCPRSIINFRDIHLICGALVKQLEEKKVIYLHIGSDVINSIEGEEYCESIKAAMTRAMEQNNVRVIETVANGIETNIRAIENRESSSDSSHIVSHNEHMEVFLDSRAEERSSIEEERIEDRGSKDLVEATVNPVSECCSFCVVKEKMNKHLHQEIDMLRQKQKQLLAQNESLSLRLLQKQNESSLEKISLFGNQADKIASLEKQVASLGKQVEQLRSEMSSKPARSDGQISLQDESHKMPTADDDKNGKSLFEDDLYTADHEDDSLKKVSIVKDDVSEDKVSIAENDLSEDKSSIADSSSLHDTSTYGESYRDDQSFKHSLFSFGANAMEYLPLFYLADDLMASNIGDHQYHSTLAEDILYWRFIKDYRKSACFLSESLSEAADVDCYTYLTKHRAATSMSIPPDQNALMCPFNADLWCISPLPTHCCTISKYPTFNLRVVTCL